MASGLTWENINAKIGQNKNWDTPSETDYSNIKKLADWIKEHDNSSFNESCLNDASDLLNKCGMTCSKLMDVPDAYCFYPKTYGQTVILWNFNETAHPFILSYQHCGVDNVDKICYSYFVNCNYKTLIINGIQPHRSSKPSVYDKSRSASDGCHSPEPLNVVLMDYLINTLYPEDVKYPGLGLLSLHGMVSSKDFDMWFINCVGGAGYNTDVKSYPLLLSISMALSNWASGVRGTNIQVKINDIFEHLFIGDKCLSSDTKKSLLQYIKSGPTSDVPMHIVNSGKITSSAGTDKGRAVHIEHAISLSKNISTLTNVHKKALEWYRLWNPDVHKFKNIPSDLTKFDTWIKNP